MKQMVVIAVPTLLMSVAEAMLLMAAVAMIAAPMLLMAVVESMTCQVPLQQTPHQSPPCNGNSQTSAGALRREFIPLTCSGGLGGAGRGRVPLSTQE